MQNVQAALRLVRKLNASGGQYAHRASGLCRRAGFHHAGFSSGSEVTEAIDHLAKMNPSAEHLPASIIAEDAGSQEKSTIFQLNNSEHTLQLPADRLNRLENIVGQQGRSLASLASQLREQKQIFSTILHDIELLKADPGSKVQHVSPTYANADLCSLDFSASSCMHHCAPPWPEWTSFLQHLKGLPFFKESVEVAEFGAFDDPATVKRTIAKFSQAYKDIFDCLSVTHLRVLAEHGCPNDDRRTVASGNRLRNHFQIEEKSNSRDSKSAKPKLSDVMRLIYTVAEVARKDTTPDEVKLSISHLLEEIISTTSNRKHHKIVYPKTLKDSGSPMQRLLGEKSLTVHAKIGVEGSSSSCDSEMLSQHDKWKCSRCSCMNWQSKSKCMECGFQCIEKRASDINSVTQKSIMLSTNRVDTKVCVSREETKENVVSTSKRSTEITVLDSDRPAATTEGLLEQGLANVPRRLLAAQDQERLQKRTLSEEDEKNLGGAGLIDVSNADEHLDIFDDIFDSDDTSSLKNKQNNFKKCSLSNLVRQNKRAFSSSKRERGAATGADDYEQKGERPFNGKGYKPDDLDVSTRRMSYRAEQGDSFMEAEDKGMLLYQSGGGQPSAGSSMVIKHYDYKAAMGEEGSSGRRFGDNRPRNECRQHYNRERYSDAESEEDGRYSSGKIYVNERPRYKESKAPGRYSDEFWGFGSKFRTRGRF